MAITSVWSVFLGYYVKGMTLLFENQLSFLRMDLTDRWPMWVLIAVAFVVGDLAAWFHHWIRHKSPVLWRFHQVHHSQTEMNLFTDSRVHFLEPLVTRAIAFGPFFAIGGDFSRTIFVFGVLQPWYARFYHANIRTNLGPLKHILVTPQYHRIHHSSAREHHDKNFGDILTIWDRVFGTLYPSYDEYPDTGVTDPSFPLERSRNPLHLLANGVRQLIYPFPRGKSEASRLTPDDPADAAQSAWARRRRRIPSTTSAKPTSSPVDGSGTT